MTPVSAWINCFTWLAIAVTWWGWVLFAHRQHRRPGPFQIGLSILMSLVFVAQVVVAILLTINPHLLGATK